MEIVDAAPSCCSTAGVDIRSGLSCRSPSQGTSEAGIWRAGPWLVNAFSSSLPGRSLSSGSCRVDGQLAPSRFLSGY